MRGASARWRLLLFLLVSTITLQLPISHARNYSDNTCAEILGGSLETIKTTHLPQVANQRNTSLCWLFSYVSLLESELKRRGNEMQISAAYILRSYLLEQTYKISTNALYEDDFEEGYYPERVNELISSYGAMPKDVWEVDLAQYGGHVGYWIGALKRMTKRWRAEGLNVIEIRKRAATKIDVWLGSSPPREFVKKKTKYTAQTFAQKHLSFPQYTELLSEDTHNRTKRKLIRLIGEKKAVVISYLDSLTLTDDKEGVIAKLAGQRFPSHIERAHAALLTGYMLDQDGNVVAWRVQQSWGAYMGIHGHYWMSDEYFRRLVLNILHF